MGLKRREFQDVGGLRSAFAGGVISTGIPQGGARALAPVCCISWEEGKPGSKLNVRNAFFCRIWTLRVRSCRVWQPWNLAYRDPPIWGAVRLDVRPALYQLNDCTGNKRSRGKWKRWKLHSHMSCFSCDLYVSVTVWILLGCRRSSYWCRRNLTYFPEPPLKNVTGWSSLR